MERAALKREEGATSQGIQVAMRSRKKARKWILPSESLLKGPVLYTLTFTSGNDFGLLNYKTIRTNLCCFKAPTLW